MFKKSIYILIFVSLAFSTAVSAEALKRFSVPSQGYSLTAPANPGYINEDVFMRFREQIRDYNASQIMELESHFTGQLNSARATRDSVAISYYERLIGILRSR